MAVSKVHNLLSDKLFRENESIFVHKSSSLPLFIETNHVHDFIEITYIISGECIHIENDKHFSARKGDLFIVNYGIPHQNIINKKNQEPYLAFDCAFKPDFIDDALLMNNMYEEYEKREKGYYILLKSLLTELIIKIFRKMDKNENITLKSKQEYYINLAIQYIENNYMNKLSLEDIAYRSFLSKSYFSQLFKEVTGMTFSLYCQKVRIEKACKMLVSTDDTIQSIAEKVGYTDMKFFYNVFKRLTGEIPGDYKKNHV